MISARDVSGAFGPAELVPASPANGARPATAFRERLLLGVLFAAVLTSSIAFIEPSPHDLMMGVLGIAALAAGVRFHRLLLLPFVLLLAWNFFGLMTLLNVPADREAVQYAITSVYLAGAAMLFAVVFADNTMPRLTAMRRAYILTAAFAALCGIAGYFNLFPGAERFTLYGRALGTFKDPNVYAPFLILPALFLLERMLNRHIDLRAIVSCAIILFGLLLGFSRGAWFHFGVSLTIVIALSFLTAPTQKARLRILGLTLTGLAGLVVLLAVLLASVDSIGGMFAQRAQLIQNYDVGTGGRFQLQALAVDSVLSFPNGMGPFEFSRVFGLQQHNVYLQAFLVYGWAGGLAYLLLIVTTLWVGFKTALTRTPWQGCAIAAYGTYVGVVLEGFIIDTDHWRHYFLILGLVWGLAAATRNVRRHPANAYPAAIAPVAVALR